MLLCTSCYTYTYLTTAAREKQRKAKEAHSERRAQRASERPSAAKNKRQMMMDKTGLSGTLQS